MHLWISLRYYDDRLHCDNLLAAFCVTKLKVETVYSRAEVESGRVFKYPQINYFLRSFSNNLFYFYTLSIPHQYIYFVSLLHMCN